VLGDDLEGVLGTHEIGDRAHGTTLRRSSDSAYRGADERLPRPPPRARASAGLGVRGPRAPRLRRAPDPPRRGPRGRRPEPRGPRGARGQAWPGRGRAAPAGRRPPPRSLATLARARRALPEHGRRRRPRVRLGGPALAPRRAARRAPRGPRARS